MQHPFKIGRDGKPQIQLINKRTVDSGKAAKLGYIPVQTPEAPPKPVAPDPVIETFTEQSAVVNEEVEAPQIKIRTRKPNITKAEPTKFTS